MPYEGQPDFQNPLEAGGAWLYYAYGTPHAPLCVVPRALALATRASGDPDFSLELFRGPTPDEPPAAYGVMDFRLTARYPLEEAFASARVTVPNATVCPMPIAGGCVQFTLVKDVADGVSEKVLDPLPIASDGLGNLRVLVRMNADAAMLIERSLSNDALLLSATAELEVLGVSPRLPFTATFDPAGLLKYVSTQAAPDGTITRAALLTALMNREQMPCTYSGDVSSVEPLLLAEVLCDRMRLRYAHAVYGGGKPAMRLTQREAVGTGRVQWNLAAPELVPRPVVLTFDPLLEARALVTRHGLNAVVTRTAISALNTGYVQVLISANLPACRPNVVSVGANLRAPANPPRRPQPIAEAMEFMAPADRAEVTLRFAPNEPQKFSLVPFAVVSGPGGTLQSLEGQPVPASGNTVMLRVDQFPLRFVTVELSESLLLMASATVVLLAAGKQQSFPVPDATQTLTLGVPVDTAGRQLRIDLKERQGDRTLSFGPVAAAPLRVGLTSFREFGAHAISIECELEQGVPLFALDLQAEDADRFDTVAFTPGQPGRTWSWTARSPFRAGYRYRWHGDAHRAAGEWSDVQSPFADLKVKSAMGATASVIATQG